MIRMSAFHSSGASDCSRPKTDIGLNCYKEPVIQSGHAPWRFEVVVYAEELLSRWTHRSTIS